MELNIEMRTIFRDAKNENGNYILKLREYQNSLDEIKYRFKISPHQLK